jgi:putative membrane protein
MAFTNTQIIQLLIDLLLNSVVVFLVVKILPGLELRDFPSAIWVVISYALLNTIVNFAFGFFGLDSVNRMVSQGVVQVIFNAILIMVVDRFVEGFEVKNFWYALLGSFVFTFIISLVHKYVPFFS